MQSAHVHRHLGPNGKLAGARSTWPQHCWKGCWGPLSVAAWVYDLGVHTALGGTMKHWTFGITPSAHRVRTVKHVPIPKADICEAPGGDCWRNAVIVINLMPEPHQTLRS